MKRNFWLILAVLSLLGMIIMPGTAHSAVIAVPTALPTIDVPRIAFPNYPLPLVSIRQPQIQLVAPQLRISLVPTVVPTVIPTVVPTVLAAAPAVLAPVTLAQAPGMDSQKNPAAIAPQSAIPASRIEGVAAQRKARKGAGGILARMAEKKEGGLPSGQRIAALFDGSAQPEPAAVPVGPAQSAPADASEDTSLTLPESDLAEEIGLGY
ncbi:MAG: hypothetical protein NTY77_14545 [Elusimicrobia bacterium]|nr:hypothetical protein [Elusimicrobiota bacterium]